MNEIELVSKIDSDSGAEALSALCVYAKTRQGREQINSLITYDQLFAAATDPIPKKRKNAYRLIGSLENKAFLPVLREALERETTLFTIPSLILALGALEDIDSLRKYTPPVSDGPAMDKHVAEISLALKKALQSSQKQESTFIRGLDRARTFLCYAPEGFNDYLAEELRSLGFSVVTEKDCCRISTDDLDHLYKATRLTEALIPIQKNTALTPAEIRKALSWMPREPYRIELRGYLKDRAKLINALVRSLPGDNNPSCYSWELRIDCREDVADLYWKPCKIEDMRYPWRKNTLPASMHPALAACLAGLANKLVSKSPISVLDPFCGSGSLLFSVEKIMDCSQLRGVDKSSTAIEIARANALAGRSRASFITKDILHYEAKKGFDLVISNMPFGLRVGSHINNKDLYRGFVKKLPYLIADNGVAVLYTMEYKLLQSCIRQTKGLRLRNAVRTEAGGLLPWIFIIDKE